MVAEESEQQNELAMDRLLLYLRCLHCPAPQVLELALKALEQAGPGVENPLAAAMDTVRRLAAEQGYIEGSPPRQSSAPPCRRRSMVSEGAGGRRATPESGREGR